MTASSRTVTKHSCFPSLWRRVGFQIKVKTANLHIGVTHGHQRFVGDEKLFFDFWPQQPSLCQLAVPQVHNAHLPLSFEHLTFPVLHRDGRNIAVSNCAAACRGRSVPRTEPSPSIRTGVLVVYCEQIDNLNGEWACTEGGKETGREGETKQHPCVMCAYFSDEDR